MRIRPSALRVTSNAELAEVASAANADGTTDVSRWIADAALEKAGGRRPTKRPSPTRKTKRDIFVRQPNAWLLSALLRAEEAVDGLKIALHAAGRTELEGELAVAVVLESVGDALDSRNAQDSQSR